MTAISKPPVPTGRRVYRSPRRSEQAERTRREILRAAEMLFAERGYAAVSVSDIAVRAGVAVATVHAAGGKREILSQVIEEAVTAGRGTPVGADPDGPEVADMATADSAIRLHVRNVHALKSRGARAHRVLWRAAASDPDAAEVWKAFLERMYRGQLTLTVRLAELGALRADLDPTSAADILQALMRPEASDALVIDRGWTLDRWSEYVEDATRRLLLA